MGIYFIFFDWEMNMEGIEDYDELYGCDGDFINFLSVNIFIFIDELFFFFFDYVFIEIFLKNVYFIFVSMIFMI